MCGFNITDKEKNMYIFNTTFLVSPSVYDKWQIWLNDSYCQGIANLSLTEGVELFEVMNAHEDGNRTFSVQWRCLSPEHLESVNEVSDDLCGSLMTHFGEDCLFFSSILVKKPISE